MITQMRFKLIQRTNIASVFADPDTASPFKIICANPFNRQIRAAGQTKIV
jgi:hypothetical protein